MCGVPRARATRTRVRRRGPRGLRSPDFAPRVLGDGSLREPVAIVGRGERGAGETRAEIKQQNLTTRGRESRNDLLVASLWDTISGGGESEKYEGGCAYHSKVGHLNILRSSTAIVVVAKNKSRASRSILRLCGSIRFQQGSLQSLQENRV